MYSIGTGHDFFSPQPSNDVSVFLVKNIIHNWSDPNASNLLTSPRNAAQPNTTLLVCDIVMTYSCREPSPDSTKDYTIVEDPSLVAPDILSTGFNSVNGMVWMFDVAVCVALFWVTKHIIIVFSDALASEHTRAYYFPI